MPDLPESNLEAGVLPTEIRKLVDRRRAVKKLMHRGISDELMEQVRKCVRAHVCVLVNEKFS